MNHNQTVREHEFLQKIEEVYPGEYEVLTPFISTKKPLTVRHSCGDVHTYSEARNIFRGGCRACWNKSKTLVNFSDVRDKLERNGITVTSGTCVKVEDVSLKCNACGFEFSKRLEAAARSPKCPRCEEVDRQKKAEARIELRKAERIERQKQKREVKEATLLRRYMDNGYSLMKKDGAKVVFRHDKCGRLYETTLCSMQRGSGCRACSRCGTSKAVEEIEQLLDAHSIRYEREKRFESCMFQRHLFFDFFLPDYKTLIEYNGEQHYRATEYFGGQKALEKYKARDTFKVEWAKANGFNLVVIAWRENIHSVLAGIIRALKPNQAPSFLPPGEKVLGNERKKTIAPSATPIFA